MLHIKDGFTGERSVVLPEMVRKTCEDDAYLSQLYVTDIGYYPHVRHHYRERPAGVMQYILIYCIKGSGWYSVGGQRYDVSDGQYFVLPPGIPHAYASNSDNPWTIYWIHFTGRQASVFASGMSTPQAVQSGGTSRIACRNDMFEELFKTLSDGYAVDNLRYASSLLYGFLASFRFMSRFSHSNVQRSEGDTDDIVSAAVRYMNENIERSLTVAEIAAFAGYSVSRFSAVFKGKTGHSVLGYFNMLKVQRGCQLLETTDMKINQICSKVGIDDSYYFSRLFRKCTGIPPKEYRLRAAAGRKD